MTNEEKLKINIVEWIRNYYKIEKYPKKVEKLCNECAKDSAILAYKQGFVPEPINLTNLGIPEPFHRANLIGFNTENGPKWYIVDLTYGQFFYEDEDEKEESLKNNIFKNYMFNNYKEFSNTLLEQGYIECTLQNMLYYINGFALSNAYTNDINIKEVYEKVEQLLLSNNIVNKEIHNTYQRLVELLYLRQDIINTNTEQKTRKNNTL